jgi:hypothetical protein
MADPRVAPDEHIERINKLGLRDDAWRNQPAILLGGGPSIGRHGFRISELQGKGRIFAVNRSIELPLEPDVWVWMDRPLYMNMKSGKFGAWAQYRLSVYRGPRITRTGSRHPPEVIELGYSTGTGLGPTFHAACISNNTGYWALNLAYCLGCEPIVLFGYDLAPVGGNQGWWHGGYGKAPSASPYERMRKHIEGLAPDLKAANRRVWNCSPGTAITTYEVVDNLDEIIKRLDEDKYEKAKRVGHGIEGIGVGHT